MFELMLAHLVGDYILQNDWMAKNKKNSPFVCAVHTLMYSIPFIFLGSLTAVQFFLIMFQHYVQDSSTFVSWFMKTKGSTEFHDNMGPWSIILTDNILHILWIYLVVTYVPW